MSKELAEKVSRLRNTYHYTIESDQGSPDDEIGDFEILIPPFPYPEHQGSQLAIFTLESFHITGQNATQRVPAVGYDTSGFYVILGGLGLRGQSFLNTKAKTLKPQRAFFVPNTYGDGAIATSNIYNRLSVERDLNKYVAKIDREQQKFWKSKSK